MDIRATRLLVHRIHVCESIKTWPGCLPGVTDSLNRLFSFRRQWDLKSEAPDLFLHLSNSDLVIFKGDLNHRKLTYDCHQPPTESFETAIGPLASEAGAPPVCSLRTIKSDVVVGLPAGLSEKLDKEEPGWKVKKPACVV
jgi:hypothetical protein